MLRRSDMRSSVEGKALVVGTWSEDVGAFFL